jgi:hypothetical protein
MSTFFFWIQALKGDKMSNETSNLKQDIPLSITLTDISFRFLYFTLADVKCRVAALKCCPVLH